jgi:hypothetical protein
VVTAGLVAGCIKGEVGPQDAPVITHPDLNCNSPQAALATAGCRLTLGQEKQDYIQQKGDQDWWVVNVGPLQPRSIVHVTAGYRPPAGQDAGGFNTAVNLQMNILDSTNGTVGGSLATAVDAHGSASPTILDITFRYTKNNNDLFIVLQDQSGQQSDNLSPYFLKVEVILDPDVNEPNDTPATATPIVLTATNGGVGGSNGGYLSTPGDLDYYSIPAPNPSSVMWIRVGEDPAAPSPPPHRFRLEYFLRDPTGLVVATDSSSAGSQFSQNLVQIGTARLLKMTGTYTLEVRAYVDPNNATVIPPGDLAFKYKVEVIIVPLQDNVEIAGNNTIDDAKVNPLALQPPQPLAPGESVTITGRISFVPDPDYYIVRLAGDPSGRPHLLHYKVTPSKAPARFPPVPGPVDRQLLVSTEVPAGSQPACAAGDAGVCIISADVSNFNYPLATNLCVAPTPQCLQSTRYENQDTPLKFQNLANFESVLQVPPHAGTVDYYFLFQDQGNNWADDTDYTILVQWLPEPDPAEAVPDPQRPVTMSATPGPAQTPFGGYLSYGIGATDLSLGIAPITDTRDYDGRGDDVDTFAITVPVAVATQSELYFQWHIPAASVTSMPYDLGIHLAFCVPDGGVACASVQTAPLTNPGGQLGLEYETTPVTSWWNIGAQFTPLEPAYDPRSYIGTAPNGEALTVLSQYACGCLENRLIAQGGGATMYVSVFPINRTSWLPEVPYTVEMGHGPYPYSFTAQGGGTVNCPAVCAFTNN